MKKDQQPPPPADDEIEILVNPAEDVLGGRLRGQVAGCPTGLSQPTPVKRKEDDQKTPGDDRPKPEPRGDGN